MMPLINNTLLYNLPRSNKRALMFGFDCIALPFALWLGCSLRFGYIFIPDTTQWWIFVAVALIGIPVFIFMGLYRAIVHCMELPAFVAIFKAVSLSVALWGLILLLFSPHGIPRSSVIIFWMVALLLISASRLWVRWVMAGRKHGNVPRIAIYGAGRAGQQLLAVLRISKQLEPVAFIDDDKSLQHHEAGGLPIVSSKAMVTLFDSENIQQVLVAVPSASHAQKKNILRQIEALPVQVRVLPRVEELMNCTVKVEQLRDVNIDDLLGRDAAVPDTDLLATCIYNQTVMVTGAGGSIGSELCRQIILHKPNSLLLFERNEFALYAIERELRNTLQVQDDNITIIPLLGSVTDEARLRRIFTVFSVQTVYHAAAYKHVPLVELNPAEAVQNNIMGTMITAQAAAQAGVNRFVLISTDKAVRPTNVMGATKRYAEMILQALHEELNASDAAHTCFCMVRFGNVLGSSGSVVPLFLEQIKNGGPVTVTHPEITRYFMSIPEASQLVIQAGAMATGGDVFILDMGEPVRIVDLARKIIHLSGKKEQRNNHPIGDIAIVFTGLRPGEKLYEELLISDNPSGTQHPLIMRAKDSHLSWQAINQHIDALQQAVAMHDTLAIRQCLLNTVKGYAPQCDIKDLVACKKGNPENI